MSSFRACQGVEKDSLEILRPFIEQHSMNGQYVLVEKGRLAAELQQAYGDVFMNGKDGGIRSVEIKAEKENKYGNLFIETWSNRRRFNPGWLYKLDADVLMYHFLKSDELFVMGFVELRRWIFWHDVKLKPRLYQYTPRLQSKNQQLNDTWGACVPIGHLKSGLKSFKSFTASTGQPL